MGKICKRPRVHQVSGNDYSLISRLLLRPSIYIPGRGLNENTYSLVRQYFPKKIYNFTTIAEKDITMIMNKLKNQPRKYLAFKTPNQVLLGFNPSVALRT